MRYKKRTRDYQPKLKKKWAGWVKMKIIYTTVISLSLFNCNRQRDDIGIKFNDVSPRGYSQSIVIEGSDPKTIYISGQVSTNSNGKIIGLNDLGKQTEQVFKNIKAQVEKAGGAMDDIVNIDCYFTDISEISEFRKARDKFINLENPPVSTAVQVERLINKDFIIEINAIAVISGKKNGK